MSGVWEKANSSRIVTLGRWASLIRRPIVFSSRSSTSAARNASREPSYPRHSRSACSANRANCTPIVGSRNRWQCCLITLSWSAAVSLTAALRRRAIRRTRQGWGGDDGRLPGQRFQLQRLRVPGCRGQCALDQAGSLLGHLGPGRASEVRGGLPRWRRMPVRTERDRRPDLTDRPDP